MKNKENHFKTAFKHVFCNDAESHTSIVVMIRARLTVFIFIVLALLEASASPARRGFFQMTQPDGTTFTAKLTGDEFCRILTTEDGCAITKDNDGFYQYAFFNADGSKVRSGYRVGEKTPALVTAESRRIPYNTLKALSRERRLERDRLHRKTIPTRTPPVRKKCLVMLVQFPDLEFKNPLTRKQEFEDMVNQAGYSTGGATGSILDYFNDQFKGACDFEFTVSDIVTVSRTHDYYGRNNEKGEDSHPGEIVTEACTLLDPVIDFSELAEMDNQLHKMCVKNIYVIVAGKSEAEGGDPDLIWPHQGWIKQDNFMLDGVTVTQYAMSTELVVHAKASTGTLQWGMAGIGTFCHEFSHTLGLMDLYDTDAEGSSGVADGLWYSTALMDGGCYNNFSRTPPCYNAADRELLGIGKSEKLTPGSHRLEPVNENGKYLILENPNDEYEFFLFECRKTSGWDTFIGASGLAIYHVDMTDKLAGWSDKSAKEITAHHRWIINEVNCNPDHQCADMIETSSDACSVSQAFFPYKNKNSFTPGSDPSFKFNDGTDSPYSIVNIRKEGDHVLFEVQNSADVLPKVADIHIEVYQDAAILSWTPDMPDVKDSVTFTWGETSKETKTLTVVPYESGKYAVVLEGLNPTTSYSYSIRYKKGPASGEAFEKDFLTKAKQDGKGAFIFLDYLSGVRDGGKFPAGTGLPLRVFNAIGEHVEWYYDGKQVTVDGSGYFHPAGSGTLKAIVSHANGSKDYLEKVITIK